MGSTEPEKSTVHMIVHKGKDPEYPGYFHTVVIDSSRPDDVVVSSYDEENYMYFRTVIEPKYVHKFLT